MVAAGILCIIAPFLETRFAPSRTGAYGQRDASPGG